MPKLKAQNDPEAQKEMMEIVTSWMRKGLEQGRQEGEEGLTERQLEQLCDRLPTLTTTVSAFSTWLNTLAPSKD